MASSPVRANKSADTPISAKYASEKDTSERMISGSITAVSNVGPGLGDVIGPAGNFSSLPDSAKIILSIDMIMGRLEILTVVAVLSPHFWRS